MAGGAQCVTRKQQKFVEKSKIFHNVPKKLLHVAKTALPFRLNRALPAQVRHELFLV
jgi:hypothetical protein